MPIPAPRTNTQGSPESSEDGYEPSLQQPLPQHYDAIDKLKHDHGDKDRPTRISAAFTSFQPRPFVFDMFKNYTKPPQSPRVPLVNSYLKPNARYIGEQQSSKTRHQIRVEFKTVDLVNSMITGFLQITGLTEEYPEITTCFKGEIINNPLLHSNCKLGCREAHDKVLRRFSFITENSRWGSCPTNDLVHWSKLTGREYTSDEELLESLQQEQEHPDMHIYMRWKEEFLLPDLRVKLINGASFAGFYYVVLTIKGPEAGSVRGLYYYQKDQEKFQSLNLKFVDDQGHSSLFEFV